MVKIKINVNVAVFGVSDIGMITYLEPFVMDKASVNLCNTGKDTREKI